jgi:hypothetical protein
MKKGPPQVSLISANLFKSSGRSDANLEELRSIHFQQHIYTEIRFHQLLNSRSWKWTGFLRKLYGYVFRGNKSAISSITIRTAILMISDFVDFLKLIGTFIRYFLIAFLTSDGNKARNLRIQIETPGYFVKTIHCLKKSKFVKLGFEPSDVILWITEEITFSKFVVFEFALNWVRNNDRSTLYCDVFDIDAKTKFEKPNWDSVYNSSIKLLPPIFLESSVASSLAPVKIEEVVSRPLSKLGVARGVGEVAPTFAKFSLPNIARTHSTFSVVVPTANKRVLSRGEVKWLIKDFIEDVNRSHISNLPEIIVVHNREMSLKDQNLLKKYPNVKLVLCSQKILNLSSKINMGVRAASFENVIISNDDVLHKSSEWLGALVNWLEISSIGVVGPQIFYEDGTLQYAGVEIDSGYPHIIGYRKSSKSLGLGFSYVVPREVRAVTGVLMATKKSLFIKIGGWDTKLAINYNDIDYCLRVNALGFKIVYEPRSQIYHLESASRDPDISHVMEQDFFVQRHKSVKPLWSALIFDTAVSSKLSFGWRQKYLL